jgi:hypothetical protein
VGIRILLFLVDGLTLKGVEAGSSLKGQRRRMSELRNRATLERDSNTLAPPVFVAWEAGLLLGTGWRFLRQLLGIS